MKIEIAVDGMIFRAEVTCRSDGNRMDPTMVERCTVMFAGERRMSWTEFQGVYSGKIDEEEFQYFCEDKAEICPETGEVLDHKRDMIENVAEMIGLVQQVIERLEHRYCEEDPMGCLADYE